PLAMPSGVAANGANTAGATRACNSSTSGRTRSRPRVEPNTLKKERKNALADEVKQFRFMGWTHRLGALGIPRTRHTTSMTHLHRPEAQSSARAHSSIFQRAFRGRVGINGR